MSPQPLKVWMQGWPPALEVNLKPVLIDELATSIEVETMGWDWKTFHTKLLHGLENGEAPDVVEIGTTWTSRLAQESALLNITRFVMQSLNGVSTFFPRVLNSCRHALHSDQYYAAPLLADLRVLFYNDEILHTYLIHHPHAFKNWQAFEAMCFSLRNILPMRVLAWPLGHADAFHDCLPWVWAAGGDFISPTHEVLLDSERTQRAFQRLARLALTSCAPLAPDPTVNTYDGIRSQFITGQIGVMTGAFWMIAHGQYASVKTTLHPPDLFPATFVGGSNLAIVQKHGVDEEDERYAVAKRLVECMTAVKHQIELAKPIGKLPCNILAWKQMKKQAQGNKINRAMLETFDDALCYTVERGLPNLPNLAQIEEELKVGVKTIWEKVGLIKRSAPPQTPLPQLKTACAEMIHNELTQTRRRIEKFLTGDVVQFTAQEVKEIGITPPGRFDLWLEVTTDEPPDGNVYVAGRGLIRRGIGKLWFRILLALINAPGRRLREDQLLENFWNYQIRADKKHLRQIVPLQQRLAQLAEMLRKSIDASPKEVDEVWHVLSKLGKTSTPLSQSAITRAYVQRELCRLLEECNDEIKHIADHTEFTNVHNNLRQAFAGLNRAIGLIRNEPVITRGEESTFDLALNPLLAICVVVP